MTYRQVLLTQTLASLLVAFSPNRTVADEHWSFRAPRRPQLPAVRDAAWVRTPVDAFILARLEAESLRPAGPAERRALLRRVTLDLTGLPPTPEEQRDFLADTAPDAYARLVDRLLASPAYGARWARHWLDVARFAESNGYERDGAKPHAWRYRDYVVEALNKDKPFDRFLQEQLAGDELADTDAEAQIATTFLRLGTWDDEPAEPKADRYDQLDDVLGTTVTAFLGLTLRCARCHDHKFEPFSQADYYQVLSVFEPLKRPQKERADLDRPVGTPRELAAHFRLEALQGQADALQRKVQNRWFAQKKTLLPPEAVKAFQTEANLRSQAQKALVKKYLGQLTAETLAVETPEEKAGREALAGKLAAAGEQFRARELPRAYIWYEDSPQAPATRILRRGDPSHPLAEVGPLLPAVLARQQPPAPQPTAHSTGRRLWLARWMTRPDNPLTARVLVNRVWQWHFGQGLVATANDFGLMGQRPSHPELLDWLATEFVARGWSLKQLHRLIVLSSTYQTGATPDPKGVEEDPDNLLLGRWRRRRLEAEAVRDSVLAVSGQLNPALAGPGVYPPIPRAVLEGQSRPGDGWGKSGEREAARRSVYVFAKRSLALPELELLDTPDNTSSCETRPVSTTGPQALTFLNGDFIQRQASHFAARLEREAGPDPQARVARAFELAFCRPPRPEEGRAALAFLARQQAQVEADARAAGKPADAARQALTAFCLVLFNANEFVYP